MRTTAEVFRDHRAAIGAGGFDAILVNYAAAATLIYPGRVAQGHGEIRTLFEQVFAELDGFDIQENSVTIDGPVLLFEWSGPGPDGRMVRGVDTFQIQVDKIQRQTLSYAISTD